MKQSITVVRIPSWLKQSLRQLAVTEETSVHQVFTDALIAHLEVVAPDLIPEDAPTRNTRNMTIKLTNKILRDAIDSMATWVTLEAQGEEFVILALTDKGEKELGRWPLPWLYTVRERLELMARGTNEFTVTHSGQSSRIRLVSSEPNRIRIEIE